MAGPASSRKAASTMTRGRRRRSSATTWNRSALASSCRLPWAIKRSAVFMPVPPAAPLQRGGIAMQCTPPICYAASKPVRGLSAMIGTRLGTWVIDEELGRGGMGRVYRAHEDPPPAAEGRVAAVKVLAPELAQEGGFRQRFEREIEVLQK